MDNEIKLASMSTLEDDVAYIASVFRKVEAMIEGIGPEQIEQASKVLDSPIGKILRKMIG
jgi:hypothetical protein